MRILMIVLKCVWAIIVEVTLKDQILFGKESTNA